MKKRDRWRKEIGVRVDGTNSKRRQSRELDGTENKKEKDSWT